MGVRGESTLLFRGIKDGPKEDFNRQRFPEVIQKRMKRHTGWDKRKDQATRAGNSLLYSIWTPEDVKGRREKQLREQVGLRFGR